MKQTERYSRRSFVVSAIGFLPGYSLLSGSAFNGSQHRFVSSYTIQIGHLNPHLFVCYSANIATCPFKDLILPHLDSQWSKQYEKVRQAFISKGSLISSAKLLSPGGSQVAFVNSWTSQQAFYSYHRGANLDYLDAKFRSVGCQPKLSFLRPSLIDRLLQS